MVSGGLFWLLGFDAAGEVQSVQCGAESTWVKDLALERRLLAWVLVETAAFGLARVRWRTADGLEKDLENSETTRSQRGTEGTRASVGENE